MQIILFAVLVGTAVAAHLNTYDSDNKIIGGFDCRPHSQPWQVAFTYRNGTLRCGGSLINNRWIITAAHCYDNPDTLIARLGKRYDGTVAEVTEQIINLEKAIRHPFYNTILDNDIMLVKLAEPVKFNTFVQPIIVSQNFPKTGTSCLVSGWGRRHPKRGAYPEKLQCLKVPIVSSHQCQCSHLDPITPNMFCAGYTDGGKGSCQGDSGGPLVCNGELTGVVSWGTVWCDDRPGVYTKVSNYRAWIKDILDTE